MRWNWKRMLVVYVSLLHLLKDVENEFGAKLAENRSRILGLFLISFVAKR